MPQNAGGTCPCQETASAASCSVPRSGSVGETAASGTHVLPFQFQCSLTLLLFDILIFDVGLCFFFVDVVWLHSGTL